MFRAFIDVLYAQEGGSPATRTQFTLGYVPLRSGFAGHSTSPDGEDDSDSDDTDFEYEAPALSAAPLLLCMVDCLLGESTDGDDRHELLEKVEYLLEYRDGELLRGTTASQVFVRCSVSDADGYAAQMIAQHCLPFLDLEYATTADDGSGRAVPEGTTVLHAAARGSPSVCVLVRDIRGLYETSVLREALRAKDSDGLTPLAAALGAHGNLFCMAEFAADPAFGLWDVFAALDGAVDAAQSSMLMDADVLACYGIRLSPEACSLALNTAMMAYDNSEVLLWLVLRLGVMCRGPLPSADILPLVQHIRPLADKHRLTLIGILAANIMTPIEFALASGDVGLLQFVYDNRRLDTSAAGMTLALTALPLAPTGPGPVHAWWNERRFHVSGGYPTLPRLKSADSVLGTMLPVPGWYSGPELEFRLCSGTKMPQRVMPICRMLFQFLAIAKKRSFASCNNPAKEFPHCVNPFLFAWKSMWAELDSNILLTIMQFVFPADCDGRNHVFPTDLVQSRW